MATSTRKNNGKSNKPTKDDAKAAGKTATKGSAASKESINDIVSTATKKELNSIIESGKEDTEKKGMAARCKDAPASSNYPTTHQAQGLSNPSIIAIDAFFIPNGPKCPCFR